MDIEKSYLVMRYLDAEQPSFIFFLRKDKDYSYLPSIGVKVYDDNSESVLAYAVKTRYSKAFNEVVFGRTENKEEAVRTAFSAALDLKTRILSYLNLGNRFVNETGISVEYALPKEKLKPKKSMETRLLYL